MFKRVIMQEINPKKTAGHDLITGRMLKQLPDKCIKLITHIFNAIIRSGYFLESKKLLKLY